MFSSRFPPMERVRREILTCLRRPQLTWRNVTAVALLSICIATGRPSHAGEFNVLAVHEEASPLNDQWQACAASFVRDRLRSGQTAEGLAREAFDHCHEEENRLARFLFLAIGRKGAENVMALLREKYRSGLAAAVNELRTPD